MFYVYCRSYYPVYEPAEGGYYVCASEVSECAEFNTLEDAYAEFIDSVAEAEKFSKFTSSVSIGTLFSITERENLSQKHNGIKGGNTLPIFLCRARKL